MNTLSDIYHYESEYEYEVRNAPDANYFALPGIKKSVASVFRTNSHPEFIIESVCNGFNIPRKRVVLRCREREIVEARYAIFYLLKKYTEMTLSQIGSSLSTIVFDHTTVLYGVSVVEDLIDSNYEFRQTLHRVEYMPVIGKTA